MNYQKVYNSIISKAKKEARVKGKEVYYEAHHIVPVCLGGEGKTTEWKWHPNIVLLTGREHFLVHWLLVRIYPTSIPLANAFMRMCTGISNNQKRYVYSSYAYQEAKEMRSKTGRSAETIEKIKKTKRDNPVKCTEEKKMRIAATQKGKSKFSTLNYRKPKSEEHRLNISKSKVGVPRLKQQCPYCKKIGGAGNMTRWHFNNCKKKLELQ